MSKRTAPLYGFMLASALGLFTLPGCGGNAADEAPETAPPELKQSLEDSLQAAEENAQEEPKPE